MSDQELNEAENKIYQLEMELRMSRACSEELRAEVNRLKAESDRILNDAIANIDRKANRIAVLELALKPAYVEPAENGRDLVMTDSVREHVFSLRAEVTRLNEALNAGVPILEEAATRIEYLEAENARFYKHGNEFKEAWRSENKRATKYKSALEKIAEDTWVDMAARDVAREALAESV